MQDEGIRGWDSRLNCGRVAPRVAGCIASISFGISTMQQCLNGNLSHDCV